MENHLFHAVGVFTNLLSVLGSRYGVRTAATVCEESAGFTLPPQSERKSGQQEKEWAAAAVRKILVILGRSIAEKRGGGSQGYNLPILGITRDPYPLKKKL